MWNEINRLIFTMRGISKQGMYSHAGAWEQKIFWVIERSFFNMFGNKATHLHVHVFTNFVLFQ